MNWKVRHEGSPQFVELTRQELIDGRGVQIGDREPDRPVPSMGLQPFDVRRVAIFQLVALVEAHDGGGTDPGQGRLRIRPGDVLAAEPQAAAGSRQGDGVDAAVATALSRPRRRARPAHGRRWYRPAGEGWL